MTAVQIPSPLVGLRAKLATGPKSAPAIDPALLVEAERAVESMREAFVDWTGAQIEKAGAAARAAGEAGQGAVASIRSLRRLAFDIADLGGTFGYPLLTAIGQSLHTLLAGREALTPPMRETIDVHVDALAVVHGNRIEGAGGETGRRLIDDLSKAVAKVALEAGRSRPADDARA